MSIIDTAAHSVVSYDPKSSKAFSGQRLSKVSYKTVGDKESPMYGIKRESKCVSLPMVQESEVRKQVAVLAPYIVEYLQGVQDKIVRLRVDAGASSITSEEVSIAGCIEYLESNDESGRLTKESIGNWFDNNIAETLAVTLAERLGVSEIPTDAESNKIMEVVSGFRDKVAALAGGKTSYEPKLCESLKRAVNMAPAGDALSVRFTARLDKMIASAKDTTNLMDLL